MTTKTIVGYEEGSGTLQVRLRVTSDPLIMAWIAQSGVLPARMTTLAASSTGPGRHVSVRNGTDCQNQHQLDHFRAGNTPEMLSGCLHWHLRSRLASHATAAVGETCMVSQRMASPRERSSNLVMQVCFTIPRPSSDAGNYRVKVFPSLESYYWPLWNTGLSCAQLLTLGGR